MVLLLDGLDCVSCQVLKYEKYFLILAECNSLVNPIIYSYRDKDMRRTFRKILCYLCPVRCRRAAGADASGVRFSTVDHEVLSESNGSHYPHPCEAAATGDHKNGIGDGGGKGSG